MPPPIEVTAVRHRRAGPGRPSISRAEIAERKRRVRKAEDLKKKTGATYKEIAKTIRIPYSRLIYWRHDIRLKKP